MKPIVLSSLRGYGAYKVVAIGTKVFEFGGLTENRTTFWLSGGVIQGWDNDSFNFIRYYDVIANSYVIPASSGPIPPTRAWFGLDHIGSNIYFFGGISKDFALRADFWKVDVSNPSNVVYINMTQPAGPSFPGKRVGANLSAWNHAGKDYLVLFGGLKFGAPGGDQFVDLNETWLYDVSANSWSLISLNDPNGPTGRARHASTVYNDKLFIHGGELYDKTVLNPDSGLPGYVHYVNDTWTFDLLSHTWNQEHPANEPRTSLHGSAERVDEFWHLHGGDYGNCTNLDLIHPYTYILNLRELVWYRGVYPEYDAGPALKRHECAFVESKDHMYCSGGFMGSHYNGYLCTNAEQVYPRTIFAYKPRNMWLERAISFTNGHGHHH